MRACQKMVFVWWRWFSFLVLEGEGGLRRVSWWVRVLWVSFARELRWVRRVVRVVSEGPSFRVAEVIRLRAERAVDSADTMMGAELHCLSRWKRWLISFWRGVERIGGRRWDCLRRLR